MALQDLTPQLRTRLSRMERAAGWFVVLAGLLMVAGLAYYLNVMAERKGWGVQKIYYQTCLASAAGLKAGDPVKLMGFNVGEIARIEPNRPYEYYNITVYFWIKKPNYGYLWTDSTVKVSADFLGNRFLEITKGVAGVPTVFETTNKVAVGTLRRDYFLQQLKELTDQGKSSSEALKQLNSAAIDNKDVFYAKLGKDSPYWLEPAESPALNDRLEKLANQVEAALPNILALTNKIGVVLDGASQISTNVTALLATLNPVATNLAVITENLRDPNGSLGEWLLTTNVAAVVEGIDRAVENLASVTSNLNVQVQANSNILSGVSKTVMDTDDFVQGLKRHWLLRSAFKNKKTNAPPSSIR